MHRRLILTVLALLAPLCACAAPPQVEAAARRGAVVEASALREPDAPPPTQDPARGDAASRITELEQRLAAERRARAEAESRVRTLEDRVKVLEGQALRLALDRVRMEQELLRCQVDALRTELGIASEADAARVASPGPAPTPRAEDRVRDAELSRIRIPGAPRR